MDHKELIAKLGGPHAVRDKLESRGVTLLPVTVRAWALTERAIPAKYWAHLKDIADAEGVDVSMEDLARPVAARAA